MIVDAADRGAGNQTRGQPGATAKPLFNPPHLSLVALVIVAQEVQKAVEGQDSEFDRESGAPAARRLAAGDADGDGDVAQISRVVAIRPASSQGGTVAVVRPETTRRRSALVDRRDSRD